MWIIPRCLKLRAQYFFLCFYIWVLSYRLAPMQRSFGHSSLGGVLIISAFVDYALV